MLVDEGRIYWEKMAREPLIMEIDRDIAEIGGCCLFDGSSHNDSNESYMKEKGRSPWLSSD